MNATVRLNFRDRTQGRRLQQRIATLVDEIDHAPVSVMHVCGSHEQAIARYGLRSGFPENLQVIGGPGCPVCITDVLEIDACLHLARNGVHIATYGDMLQVPASDGSLQDARSRGAKVSVVYSPVDAVELARDGEDVVFFATGFETTAVATAAVVLGGCPENFSILSAHKYIPPAMEIVAEMPESRVEGFLAAGHAATITGWKIFEAFADRHKLPVVVAGFEPLDILAGLAKLLELVRDGKSEVANMFPRCVSREGNRIAQDHLWQVFRPVGAPWRGIAHVPNGNLGLRKAFAHVDARVRHSSLLSEFWEQAPSIETTQCRCADIMSGLCQPTDCALYENGCTPDAPVGACMVSAEGTCRIWHQYGGHPRRRVMA